MKMVKLVCPYCGATLSIENGIDTFYCQYCGSKIMLTGQDKKAIDAKVKLKEFEHKERLQQNQHGFQERVQQRNQAYELKKASYDLEKASDRSIVILTIVGIVGAALILLILKL